MAEILAHTSVAQTDRGRRRSINEDAYLNADNVGLWAVADGMGGHNAGDTAAHAVIEALRSYQPCHSLADTIDSLQDVVRQANQAIFTTAHSSPRPKTMGTTIVLLARVEDGAITLWAGDSRLYRLRDSTLTQLTKDHSLVQELVYRGELNETEALYHPSSNIITRAVGVAEYLSLDVAHIDIQAGDRYLLCSDGLYRGMGNEELTELLTTPNINKCNDALIDSALNHGGRDNITTVLIDISSTP